MIQIFCFKDLPIGKILFLVSYYYSPRHRLRIHRSTILFAVMVTEIATLFGNSVTIATFLLPSKLVNPFTAPEIVISRAVESFRHLSPPARRKRTCVVVGVRYWAA